MSRSLSAAMLTAIAANEGYADIWLVSIVSSGSTTRLNSSPQDALWSGNTYTGIGGSMRFDVPTETQDPGGQGFTLTVSGVDQTVITVMLGDFLRGRACTLYWGQVLLSTGVVVVDPVEIFTGILNESWRITEDIAEGTPGTVTVSTRVVSELGMAGQPKGVYTNLNSHRAMLGRAGLAVTDTFFRHVPELVGKVVLWGEKPISIGRFVNTGSGGGPDTIPGTGGLPGRT